MAESCEQVEHKAATRSSRVNRLSDRAEPDPTLLKLGNRVAFEKPKPGIAIILAHFRQTVATAVWIAVDAANTSAAKNSDRGEHRQWRVT